VQAAFVLAVGLGGESVPPEVLHRLRSAHPPSPLVFPIGSRLSWSDRAATTLIQAWAERRAAGPADWAWCEDDHGVCVVTGPLRRAGARWLPPDKWATLLASATRPFTVDELDGLTGEFSGVVLAPDGRGVAVTDAFANRALYVCRMSSYSVIGSNPALVAATIHGSWDAAPLDPVGVCGLAYTKHRIGERTGFEGVHSVPIGSYLEIGSNGVVSLPRRPPWSPGVELDGSSRDALVDHAQASLEDEVVAASEIDASPRLVGLTGGKDSRLVLALAMTAGVKDRFLYRTDGPPTILDVEIAREIAALADVRWTNGAVGPSVGRSAGEADRRTPSLRSWRDRMVGYVRDTGGFCNIADTSGRGYRSENTDGLESMRVNGLSGELLRSMLGFELPDERALVRRFDRHFGHLDLLRPEWMQRYRAEWVDDVLSGSPTATTWNARHDSFLLRTQVRSNCGPRLELSAQRSVMPLSSLAAVRSVYALPDIARVDELVHHEIIARASPHLAEHRFVKGTWRTARPPPAWATAGPRRRRWRGGPDLRAERLDRPATKAPVEIGPSLPASTYRVAQSGYAAQIDLLRELISDQSNPAWEIIDRAAVAAATDRFGLLPRAAHVELLGAATAALWLAKP
jgi:hypothetical protein